MSKYLHELCCSIIEDYHGEFYARIFFHLTRNGRYTATQLAQKSHLPLKQVKAGVAALIQLRLIHHHTTNEGVSTYQANTRSTYDVLRIGKLVNLARLNHGDLSAEVLTEAALLGFATIAEIQDCVSKSLLKRNNTLQNGSIKNETESHTDEQEIDTAIQTLTRHGFLTHVRSAQFQTEFDAGKDVETTFKSMGLVAVSKGRKAQLELEDRIQMEVRMKQSSETAETGYVPTASAGQKRAAGATEHEGEKRQKLPNGSANRLTNGEASRTQSATLVYVNYGNVIANIRNKYLGDTAKKLLGPKHSRILELVLSQVPVSDPYHLAEPEHWLNLASIRDSLNSRLSNGLLNGAAQHNGTSRNNRGSPPLDQEDYISYGDFDRHLALLSEGIFNFLQGGYSKDQWRINQKDLASFIQRQESVRIMSGRIGPPAVRILHMLMEKGKLDEKTLQETGLLNAKDLRQTLAELSQMGFIDLQEVPREAQRLPNRTIFLWFHDPERVRRLLLERQYKSMTRLCQRLRAERRGLTSTLEKVERSDVKGSEEQMLPAAELVVWKQWQRKERWLLGELSRLDDSVAILRDL